MRGMQEIADSLAAESRRIDEHLADRDQAGRIEYRILKLGSEWGELTDAWLGVSGQNRRKGITHTREDLKREALDLAVTALEVWEHLDGAEGRVMHALLQHVRHLDQRDADPRDVLREEGTRAELIAQLRNIAIGCLGSDQLRDEAVNAAVDLEAGDSSVRVGHTVYQVTDR